MIENNSKKAAKDFLVLLQNGKIRKTILPNTALNYSGYQEAKDLRCYKRFLQSFAYDDIKKAEVRPYNGD